VAIRTMGGEAVDIRVEVDMVEEDLHRIKTG
jgi:hypothetical protein